jgi:hypothetical protein
LYKSVHSLNKQLQSLSFQKETRLALPRHRLRKRWSLTAHFVASKSTKLQGMIPSALQVNIELLRDGVDPTPQLDNAAQLFVTSGL